MFELGRVLVNVGGLGDCWGWSQFVVILCGWVDWEDYRPTKIIKQEKGFAFFVPLVLGERNNFPLFF